jgi:dTDP-4-dehydrorhamnose reductase
MLRLAQERERLTVIDDQFGAPTGADLLADVTAHAIRQVLQRPLDAGLYHLVAGGETSWHGYAKHVLAQAERAQAAIKFIASEVAPVPTSAFPTPAQRPLNSRLDTTRLQTTFGLRLPPWQHGVDRMLAEILGTTVLSMRYLEARCLAEFARATHGRQIFGCRSCAAAFSAPNFVPV